MSLCHLICFVIESLSLWSGCMHDCLNVELQLVVLCFILQRLIEAKVASLTARISSVPTGSILTPTGKSAMLSLLWRSISLSHQSTFTTIFIDPYVARAFTHVRIYFQALVFRHSERGCCLVINFGISTVQDNLLASIHLARQSFIFLHKILSMSCSSTILPAVGFLSFERYICLPSDARSIQRLSWSAIIASFIHYG